MTATQSTQRTKLTPAVHSILVNALRAGSFRTVAAQHAGIHRATLYAWLERGEADWRDGKNTLHADLHEAVLKAEADAEVRAIALIRQAAATDWRAAAWYLEHRYQDRWGGKTVVEHSGTVKHDLTSKTDAELREIAGELAELVAGDDRA